MADELLPRVDLYRISDHMRDVLSDLMNEAVRSALEAKGLRNPTTQAGALRATEAAAYIGVGRSRFYKLLKEDSRLLDLSFTVGHCRMWSVNSLDAWMKNRSSTGSAFCATGSPHGEPPPQS